MGVIGVGCMAGLELDVLGARSLYTVSIMCTTNRKCVDNGACVDKWTCVQQMEVATTDGRWLNQMEIVFA
jgi:hypothetical protein